MSAPAPHPADNHPLVRFYRHQDGDESGRTLHGIWSWNGGRLEGVHDYIQWLFPLRTVSRFNPGAPLVTEEVAALFRTDDGLRGALLNSLEAMLVFYGFRLRADKDGKPEVFLAPDAAARQRNWLEPHNHNLLRITRILSCLSDLGLKPQAAAFLAALEELYRTAAPVIGTRTMNFWREAVPQDTLF